MNPSRATIPLIRPHQCDSDGGRIRGVLLYYHKITEYGIKCCMHAHLEAPRAPPSRGELYRCKTLFLDNFPIFFFYPNGTWTHPPTSKLFLDFWNFFNFAKPLRGFAKLIFFSKSPKKNWIEFNPPTHPPIQFIFIFGNLSVTWPEHSNHNGF